MCKIAIADYAVTQVVIFFKFVYVIYLHITWHIMKTIIKSLYLYGGNYANKI